MDFDAEDALHRRKNLDDHQEFKRAHDSRSNPSIEVHEDARVQRRAPGLDNIRGRGNASMHIAMMQGLQKTHGNRAVQRWIGTGLLDDPAGGAKDSKKSGIGDVISGIFGPGKGKGGAGGVAGTIIGGVLDAIGSLSPRDPMVEQLWRASVIDPIQGAAAQLKNIHGSETEKIETLKEIRENISNARLVVRELKEMIEENGADPDLVGRLKASINGLAAVEAGIRTHIPEKDSPDTARQMLEMYVSEAESLGDALIEESPPYNPITHKPIGGPSHSASDNPMAVRMWKMSVVQPLDKAIRVLKGHPTKQKLTEALEEVTRARHTIDSNLLMTLMGKPTLGNRVDKVSQYLLVVIRVIQDKLGKEVPLEELSDELTMRSIPMEYFTEDLSRASGKIAAAAKEKASSGDADADTK